MPDKVTAAVAVARLYCIECKRERGHYGPCPTCGCDFSDERGDLYSARYHVPRSQVWEASAGRESGCVHLHVREQFDFGRIHRALGQSLCGKRGWYEREADENERLCPRCVSIADRFAATALVPDGYRAQVVVRGGEATTLLIPT